MQLRRKELNFLKTLGATFFNTRHIINSVNSSSFGTTIFYLKTMVHKKTAVIGDPIDHSLSPKIHNHWIENEKIDVGPTKINVKKENFIRDVDRLIEEGYYGLNVTVPLKEDAYKYCDNTSDVARALKAVNTLTVNKNGVYGDNTDPDWF